MWTYLFMRCLLLTTLCVNLTKSHGRLFQPPGRSSAWRYGFSTPINYNDHELYCGGFSTQYARNGGKCGPCGDAYHLPRPRANENGGTYGRGVIVQKYVRGQEVEFGVELTANHMGYFEFRLCSHNAPRLPEQEDCFEKYLLLRPNGAGHRFYPPPGSKFFVKYMLPRTMTCKQCVVMWRYVAGSNWGRCPNGTGMVGCGTQEEFRSCADVTITDDEGVADETPGIVVPDLPEEDYDDYDDTKEVKLPTGETLPSGGATPTGEVTITGEKWPTGVASPTGEVAITGEKWPTGVASPTGEESPAISYSGQVAAIVLSLLLVLILLIIVLTRYFWKEGALKKLIKQTRKPSWPTWRTLDIPSLKISSLKKAVNPKSPSDSFLRNVSTSAASSPPANTDGPPVPPRRNRRNGRGTPSEDPTTVPTTFNQVRRPILTISSPTRVSINGVEVIPSVTASSHSELHVPARDRKTKVLP